MDFKNILYPCTNFDKALCIGIKSIGTSIKIVKFMIPGSWIKLKGVKEYNKLINLRDPIKK